tara:strand:- start:75 stop:254 length:180 start_codon:yes stop_codon:yes gene_type:complete
MPFTAREHAKTGRETQTRHISNGRQQGGARDWQQIPNFENGCVSVIVKDMRPTQIIERD